MKKTFSTSWASSKQVRKQRKYRYKAPLHLRHRFLSALLSKDLRKKYGKRNLPLKTGDEVLIIRGSFAKKKGKVLEIDLRRTRVTIEGINRSKKDGTKVNVHFNPSNLVIQSVKTDDKKRLKRVVSDSKKTESKTNPSQGASKTKSSEAKADTTKTASKDAKKDK